jgi:RNA polymerase sigma-70 factor, ECF subfamily
LGQFELREVPFTAWLYRVARNHVVDYVRLQKNRSTVCLEDVSHLLVEEDKPSGWMDVPAISAALRRLSEKQREVVLMRTLKGLSTAETAAALRKSEEAVRQLHSRGLKALRQLLDSPSQPALAPLG